LAALLSTNNTLLGTLPVSFGRINRSAATRPYRKEKSMSEVEFATQCQVIPFPLTKRVAKIRDVAVKLMEKTTDRHAEIYRNKIADSLFKDLARLGMAEDDQDEQVGAFFTAVELELSRLYDLHSAYGDTSTY
jgi:hypothetical protein